MNLPPEDISPFYKLRFALLAYANRHLNIIPGVTDAGQIGQQPPEQIIELRNALHADPGLPETRLESVLEEYRY